MWSQSVSGFLQADPQAITSALAVAQMRHFRVNEAQQIRAWEDSLALLRRALASQADVSGWQLILEYPMLRIGRRADAILVLPRLVLVLEFKIGARSYTPADREQAEDYAIDLRDFHAASRRVPIVPVLVASDAPPPAMSQRPLGICGVSQVQDANAGTLATLIAELAGLRGAGEAIDTQGWADAPYRPVPTIIEAACMLYTRHGVAEIRAARANSDNLSLTTSAILDTVRDARAANRRAILFVTGIPGAGKTLCGLNAAFSDDAGTDGGYTGATFLTGNPSLVHVLREALARDAIAGGADRRAARQKMEGVIQALPRFRDHYVSRPMEIPAERIIVVDEAQRCWSAAHARSKTRDRPVRLSQSEPWHLLDIMSRHAGFAAMICLVGGGQEIHDGEGGLAEWGDALRAIGGWSVSAPPDVLTSEARQRLGPVNALHAVPGLHLRTTVRQVRCDQASAWADAVLRGATGEAHAVAEDAGGSLPFHLTRSLEAMRASLYASARGRRRSGLLASSGARRLRAAGLGAELPHMDASAVAHWFLDRFPPDVRASNSLEVVATEFSCQGLELDYVGLCWDADLIRMPDGSGWRAREFRGTVWTTIAKPESIANQINTYRVLLTRARYDTVIFVPPGNAEDGTRAPPVYDAIADYLGACGARALVPATPDAVRPAAAEALLL